MTSRRNYFKQLIWIVSHTLKLSPGLSFFIAIFRVLTSVFQLLGVVLLIGFIGEKQSLVEGDFPFSELFDQLTDRPQIVVSLIISVFLLGIISRLFATRLTLKSEHRLIAHLDEIGYEKVVALSKLNISQSDAIALTPSVLTGARCAGRIARLNYGNISAALQALIGVVILGSISIYLVLGFAVIGVIYLLITRPISKKTYSVSEAFIPQSAMRRKSFRQGLRQDRIEPFLVEDEKFLDLNFARLYLVELSRFSTSILFVGVLAVFLLGVMFNQINFQLTPTVLILAFFGIRFTLSGFQAFSTFLTTINRFLPRVTELEMTLQAENEADISKIIQHRSGAGSDDEDE